MISMSQEKEEGKGNNMGKERLVRTPGIFTEWRVISMAELCIVGDGREGNWIRPHTATYIQLRNFNLILKAQGNHPSRIMMRSGWHYIKD